MKKSFWVLGVLDRKWRALMSSLICSQIGLGSSIPPVPSWAIHMTHMHMPFHVFVFDWFSFPEQDDLTATLVQQCRQSQSTIQRIIETAVDNEALILEALNVNDEIVKVLSKYEELKKPLAASPQPEPAMIPVSVEAEESPRVGKEDALVRKPAASRARGEDDDILHDLDEMIFGKKGGPSEGQDSKKQQKDDLISF